MTGEQRRPTPAAHVGMGYLQAVISGDTDLQADYRIAFSADQLLAAIEQPVRNITHYLGYHLGLSACEVADRLVAGHLTAAGLPPHTSPQEN